MKKKKSSLVPIQFRKFITLAGWKKIGKDEQKILRDLSRLQVQLAKYYPKNYKPEEYVNWNAEVEYERYHGGH